MKPLFASTISAVLFLCASTRAETVAGLEFYGPLTLVDSVECATDQTHAFHEYPAGRSYATNILGQACRALEHVRAEETSNGSESGAFFSYRLGAGANLVPKDPYLLVVDYPDDAPRTVTLGNRGAGTRVGYHTGYTIGDAMSPPYVQNHPESMDVPLSNQYKTLEQVMYLMEKPLPYNGGTRLAAATDGFDVSFILFPQDDARDSRGAAVRRIRLYHIDDEASLKAPVPYPSGNAPRRLITWREEMADDDGFASFTDPIDYYRTKARLMRVLGVNGCSRDLLEFGYCQYWDPTYHDYGTGWMNYNYDKRGYWEATVDAMAAEGHVILPYYEYAGGRGAWNSLGNKKLARPLNYDSGADKFVQNSSVYDCVVDITSDAAHEDFKKVLDCTVLRFRDRATFAGAWLRNRGSMPVSFHEDTVARFCTETGRSVTRADIAAAGRKSDLYRAYLAWWYGKRAEFLEDMRDYLAENGVANARAVFDDDISEPGRSWAGWIDVNAVDNARWGADTGYGDTQSIGSASWYWYTYGLAAEYPTWGSYEHHHACPVDDPATYTNRTGVSLALPFNRVYTAIADQYTQPYRNGDGRLFFARHYSLNENAITDENGNAFCGYFSTDMDRAGRACMLPELWAMAISDPTDIGYLYGAAMGRNFTRPAREFNLNFLSLPATKGRVIIGCWWGNSGLNIRRYDADGVQYYAVINPTPNAFPAEWRYITDDNSVSTLYETVSGTAHAVGSGYMNFSVQPYQMICFSTQDPENHIPVPGPDPETPDEPDEPDEPDSVLEPTVTAVSAATWCGGVFTATVSDFGDGASGATVALAVTASGADAPACSVSADVSATGAVELPLSGLAPATSYAWALSVTNNLGAVASLSGTFETPPLPLALGAPSASVADDGATATLSCPVDLLLDPTATAALSLNGAVVRTWEAFSATGVLSAAVAAVPFSTNRYEFAVTTSSGAAATASGVFVARVVEGWFSVEFDDPGYHPGTDWTDVSDVAAPGGTWTLSEGDETKLVSNASGRHLELAAKDCPPLAYTPTTPSEEGCDVFVDVRMQWNPAKTMPDAPEGDAQTALAVLAEGSRSILVLYTANGWTRLPGLDVARLDWVDLRVEFDYSSELAPRVRCLHDGVPLLTANGDDWLPAAQSASRRMNQMCFSGDGLVDDFSGHYLAKPAVIAELEIPVIGTADGDALAFGTAVGGAEVFSVTVGNPVAGVYYTAFTTTDLANGPWVAASDSVLAGSAPTLTLDILTDDAPARFVRIVASYPESYHEGDERAF